MTQTPASGADGADHHPEFDWEAVERSPEFRQLIKRKKAFVIPATIFFLAWYFGFIILAGYAPDFMGDEFLTDGLTVGYVLALSQFVMTWVLGWLYLRKADREFDPLAARAREAALGHATGNGDGSRRFERGSVETTEHPEARS
ncbi:MAG TPA: DUF485 domain-containing protein [Thermoleophilaceae bacterium]|nr:DUF485 domain-containing protein [Thermoleophilaceae bacterium]